ncbi:MAG: hypothetical protein AAF215_23210 [Cyanobacteria bacterium P01_A01_bin.123]
MWQSVARPLKALRSGFSTLSRLRLWLSLLALGFSFWTVGQLVTLRILNRAYQTPRYFVANIQPENIAISQISAIQVKIYQASGLSVAEVISDDPNLLEREFQFALIAPPEIEQAIAQELKIPLPEVQRLIYYKVRNP